jgi:hypothetical protein
LVCTNTLPAKLASVAISTDSVSGRGPLLEAFSINSVTGCLSTATFEPTSGSSGFGAVISTPGIGPATDGLNGVELFDASQPTRAKSRGAQQIRLSLFIVIPKTTDRWRPHSVYRTDTPALQSVGEAVSWGPDRAKTMGRRVTTVAELGRTVNEIAPIYQCLETN